MKTEINQVDFRKYLEIEGRKALKTIDILARLEPLIGILVENSPGKELLLEDVQRHEELLMKMYEATEKKPFTTEERVEINYLKKRILRIAKMIITYQDKHLHILDKIKEKGETDA